MAEIAERADVTRSVVYDHFASKEAILRSVLEAHHQSFMGLLAAASSSGQVDRATFRELIKGYIDQADADPSGWRILCLDHSSDPELAAYQRDSAREIDNLIAEMFGTGGSRAERQIMARALRAAVNELVAARQEDPRISQQQLVEIAMGLWQGIDSLDR